MNARFPLVAGSVLGGLAVALGAFGAHALRAEVGQWGLEPTEQARQLEIWDVAVRYQMYHALALFAVGVLGNRVGHARAGAIAAWLFVAGVAVFSGCLYLLVLTGVKALGAVVPVGGVALTAGWAVLAFAVFRWQPR